MLERKKVDRRELHTRMLELEDKANQYEFLKRDNVRLNEELQRRSDATDKLQADIFKVRAQAGCSLLHKLCSASQTGTVRFAHSAM